MSKSKNFENEIMTKKMLWVDISIMSFESHAISRDFSSKKHIFGYFWTTPVRRNSFLGQKSKNIEKEKNHLEICLKAMFRPNFRIPTLTDAEKPLQNRTPLKYTKIGYFWTKIGPKGENFQKRKENF